MSETVIIAGQQVILDSEDVDRVCARRWSFRKGAEYFLSYDGGNRYVYMHRFIMNASPDAIVDHKFGVKLDMRKSELRITDAKGNARNGSRKSGERSSISGLKGVSQVSGSKKWRASIVVDRKQRYIGSFDCKYAAAASYDAAAKMYHGEFARLNFPNYD